MAKAKTAATPRVSVDLTFAFDAALGAGRGIARAAFDAAAAQGATLVAAMEHERASGTVPFLDLPARRDLVAPVAKAAAALRPSTTDVVVAGIGGSSRGAPVLAAARKPGVVAG